MKRLLALALLLCVPLLATAEAPLKAENYRALTTPLPKVTNAEGKVEVVEFFWYGCPHCYDFEPYVEAWLKEKPEYIEFVRVPAIFRPQWKPHAQAFYTAELLGVSEQIHRPLFDAIHKQNRQLNDEAALRAFFVEQGVDGEAFDKTFNSFVVSSKLRRAEQLSRQSGIRGVPALVVDGRFQSIGFSFNEMLEVTETLARQAHDKAAAPAAN